MEEKKALFPKHDKDFIRAMAEKIYNIMKEEKCTDKEGYEIARELKWEITNRVGDRSVILP